MSENVAPAANTLEAVDSSYVLGIDLGTSTSIVAVYRAGRADVLPVGTDRITPSVVCYREGSEALVGTQAKRRALVDPDNTVTSIKREMGKGDYNREILGKKIKPEEVSAVILDHLKNGAQEALAAGVRDVVITIPANFDDNQRQATKEAGRLANLNVRMLLEEPVAAAIAYGFRADRDQTILVYDLGGGTFDVCILKVASSANGPADFRVLGKAGVPRLGGDDFDEALMKIFADELVRGGGPNVLDMTKDQGVSKKKLRQACQVLKETAEAVKVELSDAEKAFAGAPSLIKNETGQDFHLSMEVTRVQFEEAIRPLVEQSGECIKQALRDANLTIDDIDRIILVGGSTRVPCVRRLVKEMFNKEPYADIEPDTVVAQGAAIVGSTLTSVTDEPVITVMNITSHFLGIETHGQKFNVILEKGMTVPAENTKTYTTAYDNMTELRIGVFQFPEKTDYINMNMQGSACLGEFFLGPLEPAPKGTTAVEVKFAIDPSGTVKVSATAKKGQAGISKELDVRVQH